MAHSPAHTHCWYCSACKDLHSSWTHLNGPSQNLLPLTSAYAGVAGLQLDRGPRAAGHAYSFLACHFENEHWGFLLLTDYCYTFGGPDFKSLYGLRLNCGGGAGCVLTFGPCCCQSCDSHPFVLRRPFFQVRPSIWRETLATCVKRSSRPGPQPSTYVDKASRTSCRRGAACCSPQSEFSLPKTQN